jgi:hypothetical protein
MLSVSIFRRVQVRIVAHAGRTGALALFATAALLAPSSNALSSSTTSLSVSPNPANFDELVTFTVTVTPGATGTVTLYKDSPPPAGSSFGVLPLSGGQAQWTTAVPWPGAYSLYAVYSGDSTFAPSVSSPVNIQVNTHWGTGTDITAAANAVTWGQSVFLKADIFTGPMHLEVPTGTITFFDPLNFPGGIQVPLSYPATLTASNLRVGTHSFTASYSGDANYRASTSSPATVLVTPLNTTTTLVAPTGTHLFAGQTITFTASVNPAQNGVAAVGSVEFQDGGVPVGTATLSGGTAVLNTAGLAPGTHHISAQYMPGPDALGDIDFAGSSSQPVQVNIDQLSSLPQITAGGGWDFTLDAINLGAAAAPTHFQFFDDGGSPLALSLSYPQNSTGPVTASALDQTLNPNAQVILQSGGAAGGAASVGWGELLGGTGISGFGTFRNHAYGWSAVVPLETRNASLYLLAFDNTGGLATGLAISNVAAQPASIPVIIRDDTGAQVGAATLKLAGQGHTSFMLDQQYPVTAGKRGTIEFDRPPGGEISVLGLRASASALTTLPVLANVGTGGGSFAHVTYNGGFISTFYLVNTGTTSSQFTLSFLDESGNALPVPLLLPQTNETLVASSVTRTLAGGAVLVVQTQTDSAQPSTVGSAELATTGNIGGCEVFQWTTFGQEASVPVESRASNDFVLLFDNTSGLSTGVALANVVNFPETITVNLRDDTGALLKTAAITLAALGHTSFMLPTTFPGTANLRGMMEFVVPLFGKLSVIGLRAGSDGTLTTIPVLTP